MTHPARVDEDRYDMTLPPRTWYQIEKARRVDRLRPEMDEAKRLFHESLNVGGTQMIRQPKVKRRTMADVARQVMESRGVQVISGRSTALLDAISEAWGAPSDGCKRRRNRVLKCIDARPTEFFRSDGIVDGYRLASYRLARRAS